MRLVGLDSETFLIEPGHIVPSLICVSWAEGSNVGLLSALDGLQFVHDLLLDPSVHLVLHNAAFDMAVFMREWSELIPLIFAAYDAGRIRCTLVRQKLIDIANGTLEFHWRREDSHVTRHMTKHNLAEVVMRLLKRKLEKEDTWRLRYGELYSMPVADWPVDARQYAIDDARAALDVFLEQGQRHGTVANEREQEQAAQALYLMSANGIITDKAAVEALRVSLEEARKTCRARVEPYGIFREKDGTKDMGRLRELVVETWPRELGDVPKTKTGQVSTKAEVLEHCQHDALQALAEAQEGEKILTAFIPALKRGDEAAICASYNVLVATGRTSCYQPNMQQPPKKGGVRECFVARPGHVFISCDYDTLELRSLAQACLDLLGTSAMAVALRAGEDIHLSVAAQVLGISREEAVSRYEAGDEKVAKMRDLAKIANFGFPGGLGVKTFVTYAAGYGVIISYDMASRLRSAWFAAWPEMTAYFELVDLHCRTGSIVQLRSGRVRGNPAFCATANGYFQGLAADGAKRALYNTTKACHLHQASLLYGSRLVMFLHDELFVEALEEKAHDAAGELQRIMIASMGEYVTDVPITCKPVLTRRLRKGAKPVYQDGRLVPCKPVQQGDKTIWIMDA